MSKDQEFNKDEADKFYKRAFDNGLDSRKTILSISTAIVAGLFYYIAENYQEFTCPIKIEALIAISLFGITIMSSILGLRWDASKFHFMGEMNNPQKKEGYNKFKKQKNKYKKKQIRAKRLAEYSFVFGVTAILAISITILFQ